MAFRPCGGCRFARGGENAGRCWPAPEAGTRGHHYGLGQAAHLPRGGGGGQLHPCRRTAEPQPVGGEPPDLGPRGQPERSEEHTSELQSLMRISYAVFCLKKKKHKKTSKTT